MVYTGWYHSEVYTDDGSLVCKLPGQSLVSQHRQSGLTLCGGGDECVTLDDGEWKVSHTLHQERYNQAHVTWKSPRGIMVMGGCCKYPEDTGCGSCNQTVELLKDDGTTEEPFKMTVDTTVM